MNTPARPNIVLFVVDQLRRDALGCYGNTICQTPNLDQLASQGLVFDNAYTTSPVCSPARASILTGLYPHNHGVMVNTHIAPAWTKGLSPDVPTFAVTLREAGYTTDYVGKWHVHQDRKPQEYGFDRFEMPKVPYKRSNADPETRIDIDFLRGSQIVSARNIRPKEEVEGWVVTSRGIDFIRERSSTNKPFFVRIDLQEPHFENIVPDPYADMYDPKLIPPWPNFDESFEGKPASHLRKHLEWHLEGRDWQWWSRVVARYYGDVSLIDEEVGRVMAAIAECGIADRTLFIFTTDHGDALGSHKHFEKAGTMYDEVFHIPMIMGAAAGMASGRRVKQFVRLLDLAPTFAELAGTSMRAAVDGYSLVPLLSGEIPATWPDSVYCEHHGEVWGYQSQRMVVTGRWKYVYNPTDIDELYDHETDPYELVNLVDAHGRSKHAAVLDEMKARLLGWNDATGDMFKWNWVKWNFPEPVHPLEVSRKELPRTCE